MNTWKNGITNAFEFNNDGAYGIINDKRIAKTTPR